MNQVPHPLQALRAHIERAESRFGRAPGSVSLLAVSKMRDAEAIRALAVQGQGSFGENYLQDALPKLASLEDL